jgi:hypothetical protein
MIGSMLCKLPSEIHVNGRRVQGKSVEEPSDSSPKQKPARVLTAEGREVVGPWYIEHTCIGVHEHADSNLRDRRHLRRQVVYPAKKLTRGAAAAPKGRRE